MAASRTKAVVHGTVEDRVAATFTRSMRATTSPYGVLTDPPVVFLVIAVVVLTSLILYNLQTIDRNHLPFVYGAMLMPMIVGWAVHIALAGTRLRLLAWLDGLPFAVDNVNGLLNGVAQHLVVRFEFSPERGDANLPTRDELIALLDTVHDDCFPLEFHANEPEIELVIGVPDSSLNPATTNHKRFVRVRRMIDECLVPISDAHQIVWVRVA